MVSGDGVVDTVLIYFLIAMVSGDGVVDTILIYFLIGIIGGDREYVLQR
jgi:hypothetical protein